jgi:hypothetical protein
MLGSLVQLVFLVAIVVVVVRTFVRPARGGHAGAGTAFVVEAFLLPFRAAGLLLRGLGKLWLHGRRSHVRLPRSARRSWLSTAAQRAANRRPPQLVGQYVAADDPDRRPGAAPAAYTRDRFDELWQAHLRWLRDHPESDFD